MNEAEAGEIDTKWMRSFLNMREDAIGAEKVDPDKKPDPEEKTKKPTSPESARIAEQPASRQLPMNVGGGVGGI